MKLATPQISWHGKFRVLSVDLHKTSVPGNHSAFWKLASGGEDSDVKIWAIEVPGSKVEFRANLKRHNGAVNVVRFSPDGGILASGSDDRAILLWTYVGDSEREEKSLSEGELPNKETWSVTKLLSGHSNGVFDLAWSPDSMHLVSCSVDSTAMMWDVAKGRKVKIFDEHSHYVQGVCWDPKNRFVASQSADRTVKIYSVSSKRTLHTLSKSATLATDNGSQSEFELKPCKMFCKESIVDSFFRRPSFSPDGSLLITPAGKLEKVDGSSINTTFIFTPGHSLSRPVLYLPSPDKPTVAVRFCPVFYQLRESGSSTFDLPYRIVFAVATAESIVLYDSQQTMPVALVSRIHYAHITDLTWSADGRLLVVSSSDGYCSMIEFEEGELGIPLSSSSSSSSSSSFFFSGETPLHLHSASISATMWTIITHWMVQRVSGPRILGRVE
eukprot:m.23720 g.23720  ORF g.23720 m.23720 type:complete len:442 (+) comp28522_c0_seq1:1247-2572(+)